MTLFFTLKALNVRQVLWRFLFIVDAPVAIVAAAFFFFPDALSLSFFFLFIFASSSIIANAAPAPPSCLDVGLTHTPEICCMAFGVLGGS